MGAVADKPSVVVEEGLPWLCASGADVVCVAGYLARRLTETWLRRELGEGRCAAVLHLGRSPGPPFDTLDLDGVPADPMPICRRAPVSWALAAARVGERHKIVCVRRSRSDPGWAVQLPAMATVRVEDYRAEEMYRRSTGTHQSIFSSTGAGAAPAVCQRVSNTPGLAQVLVHPWGKDEVRWLSDAMQWEPKSVKTWEWITLLQAHTAGTVLCLTRIDAAGPGHPDDDVAIRYRSPASRSEPRLSYRVSVHKLSEPLSPVQWTVPENPVWQAHRRYCPDGVRVCDARVGRPQDDELSLRLATLLCWAPSVHGVPDGKCAHVVVPAELRDRFCADWRRIGVHPTLAACLPRGLPLDLLHLVAAYLDAADVGGPGEPLCWSDNDPDAEIRRIVREHSDGAAEARS